MKILSAISINIKKLKYRVNKALFLILPIGILVTLSILISSQVKNIQTSMDSNIFGELENENTLIQIEYPREEPTFGSARMGQGPQMPSDSQYSEVDLNKVKTISNVEDASLNYSVPISNVVTSDLFDGIKMNFRNISTLNEKMAGVYTTSDFTYTDGTVIPIILNSSQFLETYEDWNGQTSITLDFRSARNSGGDPNQSMPVKTRAVEYSKDALLGKEFTMTFGGFSSIATYTMERGSGVPTITKLTDAEILTNETARKDAVSKYWNYDTLAKGNTYTFKVVGIIEDQTDNSIYIPEEFANKVVSDNISLQLSARNTTPISTNDLGSTYTGITYDGSELSSNTFGGGRMPMGPGFGREGASTSSYNIPGLVINEDSSGNVTGINTDTNVFKDSLKSGSKMSIKVNSIVNRSQVVKDLNKNGFAYQDTSNLDVFDNIQKTLNGISVGITIAFILIAISVIILTMSKFVSESKKEIGIFRAVGFTKTNILSIFLAQGLIYTLIGYVAGVALGVVLNFVAAPIVGTWFDSFVKTTIAQTVKVIGTVDKSIFTTIDTSSLIMFSIVLLVITIIVSFIPAYKASNVSPVEAIKSE